MEIILIFHSLLVFSLCVLEELSLDLQFSRIKEKKEMKCLDEEDVRVSCILLLSLCLSNVSGFDATTLFFFF